MMSLNLIVLFLILLTFVSPAYSVEVASEWFQKYQPIDDQAASAFVDRGLAYARQLLGEPRGPVKKVYLRKSTPVDPGSNIRRDFQLCEITDSAHGAFTIYLRWSPNEYSFYGQLAHEIAHLLNARLFDVYVEGLNTVFAERLLKREGKDWSGWETHFANSDKCYGNTYAMMKQVWDAVGDEHITTFLSFVAFSDAANTKMYVDIDQWIASLPADLQPRVRGIILKNAPAVHEATKACPDWEFKLPKDRWEYDALSHERPPLVQ